MPLLIAILIGLSSYVTEKQDTKVTQAGDVTLQQLMKEVK